MTLDWIKPDAVFDGRELREGVGLRIEDERVVEIGTAPKSALPLPGTLCPGFVDLQVNGGGGVLFNNTPNLSGIVQIADAHRRFGTVAIMPTVITDKPDVLALAADAVLEAQGLPGVVGIHIEGPHISVSRRGTHSADRIRRMDDATLKVVERLRAADCPVMVTVAPENCSTDYIAKLAALGAVVSIGHTDSDAKGVRAALEAGASCATHLFNAMSQMTGREPGAVGAIINSEAYAGIICDGHHVADEMIGLAIRARPVPDRMFLVSDSMATVGGPDNFMLYGKNIRLEAGRLINDEGSLAGAHVTQAEGLRRLVRHVGVPVESALRMVTSIPADCIGRPELGRPDGRAVEDLLLLSGDLAVMGSLKDRLVSARGDAAA